MNFKVKLFFIITIFHHLICLSQKVSFEGVVSDSLLKPLANSNITLIPQDSKSLIIHLLSDIKGEFKIKLNKNRDYQVIISHLGYKIKKLKLISDDDIYLHVRLLERIEELDEVIIEYSPPFEIKKDTTSYNVDYYVNGKERKLREILKKLPGIDVDKEGNVTSKGNRVTTVLVENRTFFNGNTNVVLNILQ